MPSDRSYLTPPRGARSALRHANMSTCKSRRGAAVVTDTHGIFAAHNHMPQGQYCTSDAACKATCARTAVHAEQAALLLAGVVARGSEMVHVKSVDGVLVASGPPSCIDCSKLMVEAGIVAVWLYHGDGWMRYEMADFHMRTLEFFNLGRQQTRGGGNRLAPTELQQIIDLPITACPRIRPDPIQNGGGTDA